MTKKKSDKQLAGIKAHAEQRNKETIEKVNKAIDKLKRSKTKQINFDTVSKEAGVSRATLYNNSQLKERILGLRAIKTNASEEIAAAKDKSQLQNEKIVTLRERIRELETDKHNLLIQLVELEVLKKEIQDLKKKIKSYDTA